MYREEIELKLIELRKQLEDSNNEYENVVSEIEDLEYEAEKLKLTCNRLERTIEDLEKELTVAKNREVDNSLTGDNFKDSFIKASYFCRKFSNVEHDPLQYVKIEEDKLLALDGYRGIVVNCSEIPQELQNTFIKWVIRDNFKEHKNIGIQWLYEINEIIDKAKSNIVYQFNADDFYAQLYHDKKNIGSREAVILEFMGKKVAFNKKYLDETLMVFGNTQVTLYYPEINTSPLVIKNDNQKAMILPIGLNDY